MVIWKRFILWEKVPSAPTQGQMKNAALEYQGHYCRWKRKKKRVENKKKARKKTTKIKTPVDPHNVAGSEGIPFQLCKSVGINNSTYITLLKKDSHFASQTRMAAGRWMRPHLSYREHQEIAKIRIDPETGPLRKHEVFSRRDMQILFTKRCRTKMCLLAEKWKMRKKYVSGPIINEILRSGDE